MSEYFEGQILVEKLEHHVIKLTIDRPPVNAMSLSMFDKLYEVIRSIETDKDVRAMVICSSSMKMFGAGSDVKQYPDLLHDPIPKKLFRENQIYNMIEYLPIPSVAAIEGTACGGGMELAVACDFRYISETSRVAFPEINVGLFPSSGGVFRTAKLVGPNRAMELCMTGEFIPADEAFRIGLVNKVCKEGTVLEEAVKFAEKLASRPPMSIQVIKESARETWNKTSDDALYKNLVFAEKLFRSPDGTEGIMSFVEKRPPNFDR